MDPNKPPKERGCRSPCLGALPHLVSKGNMGKFLTFTLAGLVLWTATAVASSHAVPVIVGLDGEFALKNSTSAQSIERGILIAIDEINRAGGVLGGRALKLITKDNHSNPARGLKNVREFAEIPDLVAVVGGRFSPVLLEQIDLVHEKEVILLAAWSAADPITSHGRHPNYVFRLSLRDSLAMPTMLRSAENRGFARVGLMLLNTAWGRSNMAAAERYVAERGRPAIVEYRWFNWRTPSMLEAYRGLRQAGAEAIVFVGNDAEGALLVREVAALPEDQRLPILSHWGVTGGDFVAQIGDPLAFDKVDFLVVQTFSFFKAEAPIARRVRESAKRLFGLSRPEDIEAPVGLAHAYDLVHILARAIETAGTTNRRAVRDALESIETHQGLIKSYARPFTPDRHEALSLEDVFMARYRTDGAIVPEGHAVK